MERIFLLKRFGMNPSTQNFASFNPSCLRSSVIFAAILVVSTLVGCNQNRYQPADWQTYQPPTTLPRNGQGTIPGRFGTMPGRLGTLPGRLGTLPGRFGTLPGRFGTLPDRSNTLPDEFGTLPRNYGTLPNNEIRNEIRLGSGLRGTLPSHLRSPEEILKKLDKELEIRGDSNFGTLPK